MISPPDGFRCLWRPVAKWWWMERWSRLHNMSCTLLLFFFLFFTTPSIFKLRTFRHSAQAGSYFVCIHEWLISAGDDGETDKGGRVKQLQDSLGFRQNVSGQPHNPTKWLPQHTAWVSHRCSDAEEERLHTAQPKQGGTRWHNNKESRKSAKSFVEERKLLAPTSLTYRRTGSGDVIPSFYDFSALARTPSASSCQRCLQLKLRQSCNF